MQHLKSSYHHQNVFYCIGFKTCGQTYKETKNQPLCAFISRRQKSNLSSIGHSDWSKLPVGPIVEAGRVGTVRGHHAVQGGTTWGEPFLLGLIATQNQAHEFAHAVSWILNGIIKFKKNEMWFAFPNRLTSVLLKEQ
jgi:hypothetical protein